MDQEVDEELQRELEEDLKKRQRIKDYAEQVEQRYQKREISASMEEAIAQLQAEVASDYHIDADGFDLREFLKGNDDLLDSYLKYIGGKVGKEASGGVMVQCPFPDHDDRTPSANINVEKMVGYCYACAAPFDLFDLAGIAYHMNPRSEEFPELMYQVGQDLGFEMANLGGRPVVKLQNGELLGVPTQSTIVVKEEEIEFDEQRRRGFEWGIPWWTEEGQLFPAGSFMDVWINAHRESRQRIAVEFVVATGMIALAQIAGPNTRVTTGRPTHAALPIVLMGATGTGKTNAVRELEKLLAKVNPFDYDNGDFSRGTKWLESPGSGQKIVIELDRRSHVPAGVSVDEEEGIRSVIYYDEFEALTSMALQPGSQIKAQLMSAMTGDTPKYTSIAQGSLSADNSLVTVLTTSQPNALKRFMNSHDQDSGWVNRWLFFTGERVERHDDGDFAVELEESVGLLKDLMGFWSMRPFNDIEFTEAAHREYTQFLKKEIDPLTDAAEDDPWDDEGNTRPELARMAHHLKRLALVLAINEKTLTIDRSTMIRAIALARQYFMHSIRRTADKIEENEWTRVHEAVLMAASQQLEVTRRELKDAGEDYSRAAIRDHLILHKKATIGVLVNRSRTLRRANQGDKQRMVGLFEAMAKTGELQKELGVGGAHFYFITPTGHKALEGL